MGYFLEETSDGYINFCKDKGYKTRRSDKKKYKRIRRMRRTSKRINRKRK